MNILRLIFQNLRKGTVSMPLPHVHECTSNEYRGLIHNKPEACVGCGSCAYVCPTAAIEVTRGANSFTWSYDPGKCTFCGRCIDRCRPGSLSIESELPPLYATQGELKVSYEIEKKKPAPRPAPAAAKPAAAAAEVKPVAEAAAQPAVETAVPVPAPNPAS
jgi:formate hydrogenlyase subunit 6/NADH:ubiquinone oxidoreductase subunit I